MSTGSRTYLVEAKLTPNLRVGACGEFRAHVGQRGLRSDRVRVRGAEDPPSPGNHVLRDGLGFEQVVACVEIKKTSRRRHMKFKRRSSRVRSGLLARAATRFSPSPSVRL